MRCSYLVAQLLLHPGSGRGAGEIPHGQQNRNLLTRFINIETLSFQSMLQAGRWQLLRIATLPGTNFVIRRAVIEHSGAGTRTPSPRTRSSASGCTSGSGAIKYIPYAVTYEQEPERWDVWLQQRTRWVRGNNYVARKFFRLRKHIKANGWA